MSRRVHRSRVTHDRWLVSYADFITLLFGFFVVLYAFAKADQKKQTQVPHPSTRHYRSLAHFPAPRGKSSSAANGGKRNRQATAMNVVMGEDVRFCRFRSKTISTNLRRD